MKITGGKYKGRNIEARPDRALRPTSGRIREAIFNILKHGRFLKDEAFIADDNSDLVEDRRVIDTFCGTGALGLEALSRGASHITFIDQNAEILNLARRNVAKLNEASNANFIRSDSTMLPQAPSPCTLAFVDPPYNKNLVTPGLVTLRDNGWLAHGAVIVVEQSKRDEIIVPENFQLLDQRTHDKTNIVVLQFVGK